MNTKNIFFCMDGEVIEGRLIELFDLRENSRNLRYSYRKKTEVLDFVGFIIREDDMLVSLPKHYTAVEDLKNLTIKDVNLLFEVLMKNHTINNQNYLGNIEDFQSSYPFHSFFKIYDYYKKYGLYVENYSITKPGYNGKISWKDTLKYSPSLISSNGLVFTSLYIKKNVSEQVFVSECMAYAINHTFRRFPFFVKGVLINHQAIKIKNMENKEFIVSKLRRIRSSLFKDMEKHLVQSLIEYFSNVNVGGDITVRHFNFELLWEEMVEKYLNNYFVGFDNNKLIFDLTKKSARKKFTKGKFNVDRINKNNRIEPDHYYVDNKNQYIFDSKYYSALSGIDYKQIAYFTFLNGLYKEVTKNVLILPTEKENYIVLSFELRDEYSDHLGQKIRIWAQYLNMKHVIQNYIS